MNNRTWIAVLLVVLVLSGAWYFGSQRGAKATNWQDGTYVGDSKKDERGAFGQAKLTIENGKITNVDYIEYTDVNQPKDQTYPYPFVFEAIPKYEEDLKKVQDPAKVDQITGATDTWDRFKEASQVALDKAK